jgi:hypothetical protein
MSVCGGWSMVNSRGPVTRAITLWCRSWSCPDCAPRRRAALKKLAMSGKPTKFVTLTIKPGTAGGPDEHALRLSDAFRKLIKRWRRHKHGHEVEFLAVFEPTKKGQPHLHVMLRAPYTRQEWLSRQMRDLLDSPIVDIRAITDRRKIARYVAKYITKSNIRFGTAKRYWTSPRYSLEARRKKTPVEEGGSGWDIWREPLWYVAEVLGNLGHAVEWVSDTEWWLIPGSRAGPAMGGR